MLKSTDMKKSKGKRSGILSSDFYFRPVGTDEDEFYRADLIFEGVDHSNMSYEVQVYLNNPKADDQTPHTMEKGYAGRFIIFGHGGCYGDVGHCDIVTEQRPPHDFRPLHPLIPYTKIVVITKALKYILESGTGGLKSITLVPISQNPRRKDRKLSNDLFKFNSVEFRTYG